MSLSLRRAWIEINCVTCRGIWGTGRSPYGERGLKYRLPTAQDAAVRSLSLRRAWIEIARLSTNGES